LPEHVGPHVDFITPTIHFDAKLRKRDQNTRISIAQPGRSTPKTGGEVEKVLPSLEDCDKQITPLCLRTLYGLSYEPVATGKNSFGVGVYTFVSRFMFLTHREVEYTPVAYLQSDLDMFAKNLSTGLEGVSPTLISIDGGSLFKSSISQNG
jgi:tripeptidyl-peptidase-1